MLHYALKQHWLHWPYAFQSNLPTDWPFIIPVWPLTPAMCYSLVRSSCHLIWWPLGISLGEQYITFWSGVLPTKLGSHKAFLSNLISGWLWVTPAWPLTPAIHYITLWSGVLPIKCFFPVQISILVDPKQISVVSKNEKLRKKCHLLIFLLFPLPVQFKFFHLPLCNFPSFLLHFCFFLASLFPVGQQKFPGEKHQGGTLLPAPSTLFLVKSIRGPLLLRHWVHATFPVWVLSHNSRQRETYRQRNVYYKDTGLKKSFV